MILAIGVLAQAVFAAGFAGIPVTGILMRDEYQYTLSELGLVLGAMGLGVAISELVWGLLTDKLGDKVVLIFGLFAMACVYLAISLQLTPTDGFIPSYISLGLALMLAGAVGGSINASSGRAVMSWFADGERGFAMSIRQTAIPIGGALGTAIIPWLVSSYDFSVAFTTLASACFLTAFLVLILVKEKQKTAANTVSMGQNTLSPLANYSVWRVVIAAGLLTVPQMAVLTFGGLYMHDYLKMDLTDITIVLVGVQVFGAFLRVATGKYTDKANNRMQTIKYIAIGCGVACVLLAAVAQMKILALFLFMITGVLGHAWHGIGYTEVAIQAGMERAGTALGMIGTTVFIAAFLTPFMLSRILESFDWKIAWFVVAILTLLAVPVLLYGNKQLQQQRSANA